MYKTSEWVSTGHPDKLADFISSFILDRYIERDPKTRYALEVHQFSKACPDFRRVGLVGLGIGLVQLIQYGFAIGVIGIEGMGIYVVFQPLYDIIHVGTSWLSVV